MVHFHNFLLIFQIFKFWAHISGSIFQLLWRHSIQENPGNSSGMTPGLIFIHQSEFISDICKIYPNFICFKHDMVQKMVNFGPIGPLSSLSEGRGRSPIFLKLLQIFKGCPFRMSESVNSDFRSIIYPKQGIKCKKRHFPSVFYSFL